MKEKLMKNYSDTENKKCYYNLTHEILQYMKTTMNTQWNSMPFTFESHLETRYNTYGCVVNVGHVSPMQHSNLFISLLYTPMFHFFISTNKNKNEKRKTYIFRQRWPQVRQKVGKHCSQRIGAQAVLFIVFLMHSQGTILTWKRTVS